MYAAWRENLANFAQLQQMSMSSSNRHMVAGALQSCAQYNDNNGYVYGCLDGRRLGL